MKTRHAIVSVITCCTLFLPAFANDMFLDMAVMYGNNVVTGLSNEIHAAGIRSTMRGQSGRQTPKKVTNWPRSLDGVNSSSHIFTVDELAAMRYSDADRFRRLLNGKTISVKGSVQQPSRGGGDSYSLVSATEHDYRVWVSVRGRTARPAPGAQVVVRGTLDLKRRGYAILESPTVVQQGQASASSAGSVSPRVSSPAPKTAVRHSLTFGSSEDVSDIVIDGMVETLSGSLAPGKSPEEFRALLSSGKLQSYYADLIKPHGFSDRNLADVIAAQLIISWQIANQTPYSGSDSAFKIVQSKMKQSLEQQDWVGQTSDEQKQQLGETLSLGTALILGRYEHAISTNNAAEKQMASQDATDFVKGFSGVDLRTLDLTAAGFVAKTR